MDSPHSRFVGALFLFQRRCVFGCTAETFRLVYRRWFLPDLVRRATCHRRGHARGCDVAGKRVPHVDRLAAGARPGLCRHLSHFCAFATAYAALAASQTRSHRARVVREGALNRVSQLGQAHHRVGFCVALGIGAWVGTDAHLPSPPCVYGRRQSASATAGLGGRVGCSGFLLHQRHHRRRAPRRSAFAGGAVGAAGHAAAGLGF